MKTIIAVAKFITFYAFMCFVVTPFLLLWILFLAVFLPHRMPKWMWDLP